MDKQIRNEMKKSFIGAFLGGFLGFYLGSLAGSQWISFFLIFVIGYIGYDIRKTASVTKSVFSYVWQDFWETYTEKVDYPKVAFVVSILTIPVLIVFVFAVGNSGVGVRSNPPFWSHILEYASSSATWLFTGHNPMGGHYFAGSMTGRMILLGLNLFVCFVMPFFIVPVVGAVGLAAFKSSVFLWKKYRARGSYHWPITESIEFSLRKLAGVILFGIELYEKTKKGVGQGLTFTKFLLFVSLYVAFLPFVSLSKAIVLVLMAIHSWRRLACASSALIGGVVYLLIVPFTIEGVATSILAAGCGMFCGGVSATVAYALDGEVTYKKFDEFIHRPMKQFALAVVNK